MRIVLVAALAAVAAVTVAPTGSSETCENPLMWYAPYEYDVLTVGEPGTAAVYVVMDPWMSYGAGMPFVPWIYQESNGLHGLQRGGETLLGDVDSCEDHPENPDLGII